MIKNRIYKSDKIEWEKVKDLQPENIKLHYNIAYLRNSILKYGVAKAYDVCELDGVLYWLDGHTRSDMFRTLQSEGIEIPKMLMANFCEVKDRKEAIEILIEVHNQKHNPFDYEVLQEFIEVEELDVNIESVNVKIEEIEEDIEHKENVKELTNMIAVTLSEDEQEIWLHTKEKLGKMKDKNAIFELIKLYNNEKKIN